MKISHVTTRVLSTPADNPLVVGLPAPTDTREFVLLELGTDQGLVGIGLTFFGGALTPALRAAVDSLARLAIGEDPSQTEAIVAKCRRAAGSSGPGGVFYRRDIFEEVGLPTDPKEVTALLADWDAFIEVGKKVAKPNERWLLANGNEIVGAMMAQRGVHYFDAEGTLQFDHPVFKEALEMVKKAADAGLISPFAAWSPEWQGAFGKGQVATVMGRSEGAVRVLVHRGLQRLRDLVSRAARIMV